MTLCQSRGIDSAISFNPFSPKITVDAVEWAVHFAAYVVKWMLYEAQFHVAEGKFGKLMERTKSMYWETTMTTFKNNIILRAHLEHSELW